MRYCNCLILVTTLMVAVPITGRAQSQSLPFIDQLTSPFTDAELSGLGCLTASTLTGGMLVYLMGGFSRIAASMQGVMPPIRVMEGAAAVSFIFSSVCYIGSALAPLAMSSYTSFIDSFPEELPTIFDQNINNNNGGESTSAPNTP